MSNSQMQRNMDLEGELVDRGRRMRAYAELGYQLTDTEKELVKAS